MNNRTTNTDFISTRQKANESYGSFDYDSWVMSVIKPEQGDIVLDLGCGTGKHVCSIAQLIGTGTVVGVDKSPESLAVARSLCERNRLCNVELLECDLDEAPHRLSDQKLNIILASYSIYYSTNQASLMSRLAHLLKPHGRLFVTGNDEGNNHELVDFINNLSPTAAASSYKPFITSQECTHIDLSYRGSIVFYKTNKVSFPSPTEIAKYWKASCLYRPEIEESFRDSMTKRFETDRVFVLTKSILGVLFYGE